MSVVLKGLIISRVFTFVGLKHVFLQVLFQKIVFCIYKNGVDVVDGLTGL